MPPCSASPGCSNPASERAGVELSGIGIGCTGPVDPLSGEIGSVEFLAEWRGCNPVERLARQFDLTVAMENDADAAALGELQWGAGRGKRHLICVTVGTGIGGGIVLNGSLYRGVDGAHPEIGHHVIEASGPVVLLRCTRLLGSSRARPGHRGTLRPGRTADYPGRDRLTRSGCVRAGSPRRSRVARREIEREGNYLGIGVANLITMFAPEVIALSGSVMESADLFMPTIRAVVLRNCGLVPAASVELVPAALG